MGLTCAVELALWREAGPAVEVLPRLAGKRSELAVVLATSQALDEQLDTPHMVTYRRGVHCPFCTHNYKSTPPMS